MEPDPQSRAVEPLIEELRAVREALTEIHSDIQWAARDMRDYLSAMSDATEEIRGEILARLRYDNLPKPFPPPEETVTCAHCGASADSLAGAVQAGFVRFQKEDGVSSEYLAECPECATEMNHAREQKDLF